MNLTTMRARVGRLRDLAHGMGKEVSLWKDQEGPLLLLERKKYLEAIQDVIAGMDAAAAVLEAALVRLEKLARETGGLLP
jgi:hypothetical protein